MVNNCVADFGELLTVYACLNELDNSAKLSVVVEVVDGLIAALLELGSGFDGDMTVKENTYLRGAMLGYTKKFMIY